MKSTREILMRAMAMYTIEVLTYVGLHAKELPTVESKDKHKKRIIQWIKQQNLFSVMTNEERAYVEASYGDLKYSQLCEWNAEYFEPIRPLLWAIGLSELESYDKYDQESSKKGDPSKILQYGPTCDIDTLMKGCHMRSRAEIETQEMVAMLWHWRAIELDTELLEGETWVGVIRRIFGEEAEEALKYIPHQKRAKQDFLVGKTPAGKISPQKKYMLKRISLLRQHAFEWILSDDEWDEVTTDT